MSHRPHSHRAFREEAASIDWAGLWARQEARSELAEPLFDLAAGRRLVDVGCGPGYFALRYQQLGADVLAVDLVEEALAFARARGVRRTARVDVEAEPLPETGFDAALVTNVLHHARDPLALLRHVRPSAPRVVVAEFDPEGPRDFGPPLEERLSPAAVMQLLRAAGYQPGARIELGAEMYAIVGETTSSRSAEAAKEPK